jgi:hypothetical protein
MKSMWVIAALLLTGFGAAANAGPTVTKVDGQVVEAVWPSGNRAQAFYYMPSVVQPPVEFQVTENQCNDAGIGQKFVLNASVAVPTIAWHWVQHSDVNKVGTILTVGEGQAFPLQDYIFVGSGSAFVDPSLAGGLPPDQLVFDDVKWIPGMADGVLKDFDLDSWNAEAMTGNSQTGGQENRIVSGEIGQKLVKVGDHVMNIVHSANGGFFQRAGGSAFYLLGDVVSWSFLVNGQRCQIAFKPNLVAADAAISKLIAEMIPVWTPYVWGQDALPKVSQSPQFFTDEVNYANE